MRVVLVGATCRVAILVFELLTSIRLGCISNTYSYNLFVLSMGALTFVLLSCPLVVVSYVPATLVKVSLRGRAPTETRGGTG